MESCDFVFTSFFSLSSTFGVRPFVFVLGDFNNFITIFILWFFVVVAICCLLSLSCTSLCFFVLICYKVFKRLRHYFDIFCIQSQFHSVFAHFNIYFSFFFELMKKKKNHQQQYCTVHCFICVLKYYAWTRWVQFFFRILWSPFCFCFIFHLLK